MRFRTALEIGRVSNLPTVWTNGIAAWFLAGGDRHPLALLLLLLSLSAFYVAGMYLNDAFDQHWDAAAGKDRPIARGEASGEEVYFAGILLLLVALALLLPIADRRTLALGLALAGMIVLYDHTHKRLTIAPFLMGGCRLLAYLLAGYLADPEPGLAVWALALSGFLHTVGITHMAREEHLGRLGGSWPLLFFVPALLAPLLLLSTIAAGLFWLAYAAALGAAIRLLMRRREKDVPEAVCLLIAALALLDGSFLAAAGLPALAMVGPIGFLLTRLLQRRIAGS